MNIYHVNYNLVKSKKNWSLPTEAMNYEFLTKKQRSLIKKAFYGHDKYTVVIQ